MKIAIFATNPPDSYSGGRYLSLVMAEGLAARGHTVYYVTNNKPLFFNDFKIYKTHGDINLVITEDFLIEPMESWFDAVILVPHLNSLPHYYDMVRHFARAAKAHLVLFNFETPNWFNRLSPVKRNEETWTQWKKCCERRCLVLSMTAEADKYAREYYTEYPDQTSFAFWYPALNTLAADKVRVTRKEKRVVVISRLEDGHKGGGDILEAIDQTLAGYTLVFILGRGKPQDEYREKLDTLKNRYHLDYEFLYRLSDEEKFKEIKRASLMLFPSYFEGFGYPPLEALYCGTPCVAYDLPVLRETCKDALFYARIGDITDFKAKIRQAITADDTAAPIQTIQTIKKDDHAHLPGIGGIAERALELEHILLTYTGASIEPETTPVNKPGILTHLKQWLGMGENKDGKRAPFCPATLKYALSEIKPMGDNELFIKGWAFADEKIDTVAFYAGTELLERMPVSTPRRDVADKYKECRHPECGFSGRISLPAPPVVNLKLIFYTRKSTPLAIIEKKVNQERSDTPPAGTGPAARFMETWLTMKTDNSPEMRHRVEMSNQGKGLTENHRRIGTLYNKHKGETAILIGNGPSVRTEDLEKLKDFVTFGCNRLYLAYDRMNFRPTYLCSTDPQVINDFGAEMVARHPGPVLFVAREKPEIAGDFTWFPMKSATPLEFSENVYDFVMPGGGTLIAAIQIGYHMGITRFVLYGVDHHFQYKKNETAQSLLDSAIGDGNHFISDYRSGKPWTPPQAFQVEGAFLSCHVFLQSFGGWLKNATRGGKLDVLERIDFDEIAAAKSPEPGNEHCQKDCNTGKIKWFSSEKQFGFVQPNQGDRLLFVHKKFILTPRPEEITVGMPVSFEPNEGPKGLEARNLRLLKEETRR